ncbi:ATP-binding cassette domain-containing protein [Chryseolinea sp. T2]|uniref:ABC transporter ATP-binding protein n=1 Tax=Chryseolinea sp. T2 TaxID=3129255 RepID=UPI003077CB7E
MTQPIIHTQGLTFGFDKGHRIVDNVSLQVNKGSIYCFLGPNGAGKTTTLRLLLGLLSSNQDIQLFGKDLTTHRLEILSRTGTLIEQPSLYGHLTGYMNLEIHRLAYGVAKSRIEAVLEICGISYAARQKVGSYSMGMRQRLGICIALLHDPELLILDEPTNGLDPEGMIEVRNLIISLNRDFKKTLLISSHLLSEMERIATDVGIIRSGRLLYQGPKSELYSVVEPTGLFRIESPRTDDARALLCSDYDAQKVDDSVLMISNINRDSAPRIIELLVQNKIPLLGAGFESQNLESIYLKLISK